MAGHLGTHMKDYNFCKEKVMLVKDNLMSASVDLERQKLDIYRLDAEIAEINSKSKLNIFLSF